MKVKKSQDQQLKDAKTILTELYRFSEPHAKQLIGVVPFKEAEAIRKMLTSAQEFILDGEYEATAPHSIKGVNQNLDSIISNRPATSVEASGGLNEVLKSIGER